jgi:adenylate kinase family enzyme
MVIKKPLDDKIVVFGMSCVGKTTFAKQLADHHYCCFDAMFHWHLLETFGLSISDNLNEIKTGCEWNRFVIDGWHLSDSQGLFLPAEAKVYVVFAPYERIVSQYRAKVYDPEEYRGMYRRWYFDVPYEKLPGVRYFHNAGEFIECDRDEFLLTSSTHSR